MPTPDQIPTQAQVDQAIEWLVKLRYDSPGPRTEQQFQRWLASHPQHAQAWQRVSSLGDELASLPAELSRQTLAGTERRRMSRRDHLKLLSVLALGGAAGWAAREPLGLSAWMADSRTATGERRELLGSDGSLIRLNTASAIDLRYSADQRRLTSLRGEISLDSNANDNRPFSIDTPVGALGTQGGQLLLRENAQGLLVAVRRGEVTLFPLPAPHIQSSLARCCKCSPRANTNPPPCMATPGAGPTACSACSRCPSASSSTSYRATAPAYCAARRRWPG